MYTILVVDTSLMYKNDILIIILNIAMSLMA